MQLEEYSVGGTDAEILVKFDLVDQITRSDLQGLTSSLCEIGARTQIEKLYPQKGMLAGGEIIELLAVLTTSAAAVSALIAFLYTTFRLGVVVDLSGDSPVIYKSNNLPRGSLLLLRKNGQEQLYSGLTPKDAASIIKTMAT